MSEFAGRERWSRAAGKRQRRLFVLTGKRLNYLCVEIFPCTLGMSRRPELAQTETEKSTWIDPKTEPPVRAVPVPVPVSVPVLVGSSKLGTESRRNQLLEGMKSCCLLTSFQSQL